ncbi:MAG TPA: C-type lectin domain-containing protein [Polyangia bacterium]|nr:C-type lectin domain-containing protein [Polyangia bacterium]
MLRRVRATMAALALGSTVAVGLVCGAACSVDRAGLGSSGTSISSGGSGGLASTGGHGGAVSSGGSGGSAAAGGTGGSSVVGSGGGGDQSGGLGGSGETGGAGGDAQGGSGGSGTGGDVGAGGNAGSGGSIGTGGDVGTGGSVGTGGDVGTGGSVGTGGDAGTGGSVGTGGSPGTGGDLGTGGGAGGTGTGGQGGTAGAGGNVGTGGTHPPSCASFPKGSSFTTPTDGLLHCYWVHVTTTDWTSAESTCESEGGTLATVLSSQENMFVLQVLLQANAVPMMNVAWLGANDGKQSNDKTGPGQYAWVTGEPWSYTNWHMGQPDGSCSCMLANPCSCDHWLAMGSDGTWYDRAEAGPRSAICEAVAR